MATQLYRPRADASVRQLSRRNATPRPSVVARADAGGGLAGVSGAFEHEMHRSSVLVVGAIASLVVAASLMLLAAGHRALAQLPDITQLFSAIGNPGLVLALAVAVIAAHMAVIAGLSLGRSRRLRTELYKSTPTDQYGRFNFATVPPGGYKVFAWEEIPNGAYMDPEYIRRFEERGRVVKVDSAATVDSQVSVITARN